MRDKIYRFIRSRYGNDQLSSFLTWTGLVFIIADIFVSPSVLYFIGLVMFIWGYMRIFSKKYERRTAENRWFLEKTAGIRASFARIKKNKQAGKDHKVFACKKCHQMIRVPKGRGKIEIRCPKCGHTFVKKS